MGGDHLWHVMAHELAHAQAEDSEGHSMAFWRRLASGLKRAGRLELLRFDFEYREGALRVAREYRMADLPSPRGFMLKIGELIVDEENRRWRVQRRYRRGGRPHYRLEAPGWIWKGSEEEVLKKAKRWD